jgi:hypothetical protein
LSAFQIKKPQPTASDSREAQSGANEASVDPKMASKVKSEIKITLCF